MIILVTGANGQLGREMRRLAAASRNEYIFADVVEAEGLETTLLDITDAQAVRRLVADRRVDVIVNCAAYTNVDAAETNMEQAEQLNATAPRLLAEVMYETGGLLIHVSTDYVFGGGDQKTPYDERDTTAPTSVYGLTKLRGERAIAGSRCRYVIIRTAWLYSEFGRNFLLTMRSLTAQRDSLQVVFDQVGTPTYALDLARAIAAVMDDYAEWLQQAGSSREAYPRGGIYHYTNEGVCSWFDFAYAIAQASGNTTCRIQPCLSSQFPSPVTRPAYSVLNKSKIRETFRLHIPHWTESLAECIASIEKTK